jgi:hypothetical protein
MVARQNDITVPLTLAGKEAIGTYPRGSGVGRRLGSAVMKSWQSMINSFQDFQKLSKAELNVYLRTMGEWNEKWQSIAYEMTDYSNRSFEESTATLQKIIDAKSFVQALEIQIFYANRAHHDYIRQMSKLGVMYHSITKDALWPVGRAFFPRSR